MLLYDDIDRRRFADWSLAYSGASFTSTGYRSPDRACPGAAGPADLRRLIQAIEELARARL